MRVPITVVSWGELLWDLFPDGARLGGAAANVAYHAAQLGAEVILVSRVGADELGARARSELEAAGVNPSFIQVDPERPTGTVRVEIRDGEPQYKIATEVAWDRIGWSQDLSKVMQRASAVCFSTLAQRSPPGFDALRGAFADLPASAARICDLNIRKPFISPALMEQALALATVVKLNQSEAQLLAQLFDVSDPIQWLLGRGAIHTVALTRGAHGSLLVRRSEHVDHPGLALTSNGGDAVGAGDAFVAVLAVELARGTPLEVLSERANRYSSYVASQSGAMPPMPAYLRNT